jgi:hypothetical protein
VPADHCILRIQASDILKGGGIAGGILSKQGMRIGYVNSVADPDPGSGAFLTPGSGVGRKSAFGSGIRDEQPVSYFLELRNHILVFLGLKKLKFFDADPGSGMETVRIRDGKKSDPGSGINIPDPQNWM